MSTYVVYLVLMQPFFANDITESELMLDSDEEDEMLLLQASFQACRQLCS